MRAVAVSRFRASPKAMELPKPGLAAGEILVRVEYAGMNPFDWKIADGLYEGTRPHVFPLVLGVDAAGIVEAVGPGAARFRPGEPVVGQFLHDPVGTGTYAEFAPVPEGLAVVRLPPFLPFDQAAALPTAGMTALDALDVLALPPGASLIIVGASGGIGSFATQLAAARKVRVTAVARAHSAERLRSMGAERVLDPASADDPVALVRSSGAGGGFDGLLDAMSDRSSFGRWATLVRPGGVVASTTFSADPDRLRPAGVRGVNIDLHPRAELLDRLLREVEAHRLAVPVERRIPLAESPSGLAELKAGRGRGKTVVAVRP